MRIGIIDLSVSGWSAGGIFTRVVSHGLTLASQEVSDVQVSLVTDRAKEDAFPGISMVRAGEKISLTWRERVLRRLNRFQEPNWLERTLVQRNLDVLLPVVYAASARPTMPSAGKLIGWIPDFQHVYLPEFFSPEEIRRRDELFAQSTESSAKMLLSSKDALDHFARRFPHMADKGEAIPFPSLFAYEPPPPRKGRAAGDKFNLPAKFILVANQFWAHKNHLTVVRAAALLRQAGHPVVFVFTGKLADERNSEQCVVSEILQTAAELNVSDQIRVLGLVSRRDLLDLLRTATAILQPSRWEGWSTTIQDAKALGRPVICSDIAVHREQAPGALLFFPPLDAESLAAQLARLWSDLPAGPDPSSEEAALAQEREFARSYGRHLLSLCRKACAI